jgi:hypothetical protein
VTMGASSSVKGVATGGRSPSCSSHVMSSVRSVNWGRSGQHQGRRGLFLRTHSAKIQLIGNIWLNFSKCQTTVHCVGLTC